MADPDAPSPETVGFIGLGNMGSPMAARLAAAGVRLRLFDRDSARRDGCAAAGAGRLGDPSTRRL